MRVAAIAAIAVAVTVAWAAGAGAEIVHVADQATAPISAEIASAQMTRAEVTLSGAASAIEIGLAGAATPSASPSLVADIAVSDPAARVVDAAPAPSGWVSAGSLGDLWDILTTAAGGGRCVAERVDLVTWTTRWALLRPSAGGQCFAGGQLLQPPPITADPLTAGWSRTPPSAGA